MDVVEIGRGDAQRDRLANAALRHDAFDRLSHRHEVDAEPAEHDGAGTR